LEPNNKASVKSLSDTYLLLSYFDKILDTSLTVMKKYQDILTHTQLDKLPNFSQEISPNAMLTSTENYQNALSLLNAQVEKIMGDIDISPETDIRDLIKQMSKTLNSIKSEEVQANKDMILESLRSLLENTKNSNKVQEGITIEKWRAFFAGYFAVLDGAGLAFWQSGVGKIVIGFAGISIFSTIVGLICYYNQMIATGWYILKIGGSSVVSGTVYYILVYYADPSIANWALPLAIGSGAMSFYMAGLIPTSGNAATITTNSNVSQNNQTRPPAITDSNSNSSIASDNTSDNASGNASGNQTPVNYDSEDELLKYKEDKIIQSKGGKKQSRKIKKQNKSKKTTIRKRSRKMRRGVKTRQRRGNKSKTRKRYNSYKRKSKK
jgi:hypothetical protein